MAMRCRRSSTTCWISSPGPATTGTPPTEAWTEAPLGAPGTPARVPGTGRGTWTSIGAVPGSAAWTASACSRFFSRLSRAIVPSFGSYTCLRVCPLARVSHVTAMSQARPNARPPRPRPPGGGVRIGGRGSGGMGIGGRDRRGGMGRGMGRDMQQGPEIWLRGPVATPEAAAREADGPPGPAPARASGRVFSWVGTHGGAGVSTLAAVYGGHDSGRSWPGPGDPQSVLLVARTHAAGLDSVTAALELFRLGQVPQGLDL